MKLNSLYFGLLLMALTSCKSTQYLPSKTLTQTQLTTYKFYPGIISTTAWEENSISFSRDESLAFWTAGNNWEKQLPFLAKRVNGSYEKAKCILALDTIYNGAISPSGQRILYNVRQDDETSTWLSEYRDGRWNRGINLTDKTGIKAGYFHWYTEKDLYLYIPENEGDLAVATLHGDQLNWQRLPEPINTLRGTEFSPFMGPRKRFLIFTRYLEDEPEQQGFFYSLNTGSEKKPKWDLPKKIEALPYGWGSFLSSDGQTFYFTDGLDIFAIPFSKLSIPN